MSRTGTLILLGVLTMLTPFSGLPIAFRTFLSVLFGALVLAIGLSMRAKESRAPQTPVPPVATPPTDVSPI
ncbi:MAG: hypothetical protein WCT45_03380 [Candidatus Paceibacterota bacterium]|jgi:hypothetical protein